MILLATLNARYSHASLGLRCLMANMGELTPMTRIEEYIITDRPQDVAEALLALRPRIIGLGVYIWNVEQSTKLVALLKRISPETVIVLGGPEVSHEWEEQRLVQLADHIITGPGDLAFAELCRQVLKGAKPPKLLHAEQPSLESLRLPYEFYDERDIAQRTVYVEASRGCPFKCEFCLSALDKTAWPFPLEHFLSAMDNLHARGLRQFKFVDRTFNLNVKASLQILEFFLERLDEHLFLHFEVVPDHLPDKLKEAIKRFPPGSLQFEVGIQTFNPEVQQRISRRQDNDRTEANLRWLRSETNAHIHADLIAGLPGEGLASFAAGFDRLVGLEPHEIQVGVLKRLRGAPLDRHSQSFDLRYSPDPPYNVLSTSLMDFATLQRISRFARYWDLVGNSGRFQNGLQLLLGSSPFERFMAFSDWLYACLGKTHQLALDRLYDLTYQWLTEQGGVDSAAATQAIARDFHASGTRSVPRFLAREGIRSPGPRVPAAGVKAPARQQRHLSGH
ncbi:B12-binding domain-containing radical SAM protein [Methyloterricola oryzae]|uniref:B12-binding domain-containing radical SAM protein n=1 Tax=Methyloterricola oryzae TaxID=1495050 RepID=UPI0005EBA3EB|nr:B12-binding domain-containing radical SAM protein [Methyloterricola oryzae]